MTALGLLLTATVVLSPGDDLQAGIARAHGGRVVLRPGTYVVERTLEIGAADRGLTIVAQKPGTARLLGGRVLTGWRPSGRPHVLVRDVSDLGDPGEIRRGGQGLPSGEHGLELFFGGKPMPLARYPNAGWLRTGAVSGERAFALEDAHAREIKGDDVWALGYWNFDWAESYERAAIRDGTLTLGEKPPYGVVAGRRFVVMNALSELDSPGEWTLDRKARRLYFWPPSGGITTEDTESTERKGEVVASVLSGPMFRLKDADGVTLKGLTLEAGRGSGVRVEGGKGVLLQNLLVRNFGTEGVAFEGATDSGIVGCDLTGLGGRGIHLDGGDRRTLTPGGLFATDCHVWAYSRWLRTYQPAVAIDGVGNRVTRCLIEDAPHNAVLLGGNDHLLEGNDVRRVCLETGDSGAFYMGRDPTMRGNIIRGNRFRELGARVETTGAFTEVMSVYLDDGWPGTMIEGNVFEGPGTGVMIGGGQANSVERNVFVGKRPAVHLDARGRSFAKDMILNPKEWDFAGKVARIDEGLYAARYPAFVGYLAKAPREPLGTRIVGNVAFGGEWLRLQDGLTTKDFEDRGNVVRPSGTLADALRIIPVDLAKIGLRTTTGRPIGR